MDAEIHERRAAERPRVRGELPILFHLRDVSRPRPGAAKPQGTAPELADASTLLAATALPELTALPTANSVEPKPTEIPVTAPASDEVVGTSKLSDSFMPLVAVLPPAVTTAVPSEPAFEAPAAAADSVAEGIAPLQEAIVPLSFALGTPLQLAPSVAEEDASSTPTADLTQVVSEPASASTVVGARPARRFKTPATEKWFATHGKFIAACFVVALAGTVYLARNNRKQSPADTGGPVGPLLAETETAASPTISFPSQEAAATTASAKVALNSKSEASSVELLIPIAAGPDRNVASAEKPTTQDNLFQIPAGKRAEERVAARTDLNSAAGSYAASSNAAASPAVGTMPTAYPVTNAQTSHYEPVANAGYPQTGYSQTGYQQASYPQTSYPQTSSPASPAMSPAGIQGHVSPAAAYQPAGQPYYPPTNHGAQAPMWGPPVPPVPTAPGQSSEINARGQRYERIGSGNY